MARSGGTYTAPSNSFNPAVEGTTIDEAAWNETLDDIESALTESVYTGGMGATDNRLVRTDGTDTKKVQGTGITVDDSDNITGVTSIATTTIQLGHASDTTLARSGAGDITIEGNAVYRAGGTDVPITDGGTGASTATAAFNALSPLTTQGDVLYHNGTNNVRLAPGVAGQVLTSGGPGANPSWSAAGAGDLIAANNLSDVANAATAATNLGLGTGNSPQFTAVNIGHASDTTITRTGAGDIAVEGNAIYRAGGTDVPVTDGGTGASTAAAGFRALAEGVGSTQGDILYRNATQWVVLGAGVSGQLLQSGGAGANPSWTTASGTGDLLASNNLSDVANASTARLNLGVAPAMPQGRLTLTTATPVLTSTVSAAGTVYYTPYVGRHVPIYDGARWKMHDFAAELSQATTDATKSPAACTTNSNYDLFVWNDAGTYRCTRGPAWTSDTARGTGAGTTELEYVAGVRVNKIAITNGPAAQRGTYVGTIRTNGTSTVDFIFGGSAAGGTAGSFGVWNAYNRRPVGTQVLDSTNSWTYATSAWRAANNSSTYRVSYVCGAAEDFVTALYECVGSADVAGNQLAIGLGIDTTTAFSGTTGFYNVVAAGPMVSYYSGLPGLGFRYISAIEYRGAGTLTFYGDLGVAYQAGGLSVNLML